MNKFRQSSDNTHQELESFFNGIWGFFIISIIIVVVYYFKSGLVSEVAGGGRLMRSFFRLFYIGLAAGTMFTLTNFWWQMYIGRYFDQVVSNVASLITSHGGSVAGVSVGFVIATVFFVIFFTSFEPACSGQDSGWGIFFCLLYALAYLAIILGLLFLLIQLIIPILILSGIMYLFVAVSILRLPTGFIYFFIGVFLATIVVKIFKLIFAYSKGLELRVLINNYDLYSPEEFDKKLSEILYNTENTLPSYWEKTFKLKEMEKFIQKLKFENQEANRKINESMRELGEMADKGQL